MVNHLEAALPCHSRGLQVYCSVYCSMLLLHCTCHLLPAHAAVLCQGLAGLARHLDLGQGQMGTGGTVPLRRLLPRCE